MLRIWNSIATQHDGWLVLLTACVCFLTSIAAANLFQSARAAKAWTRLLWLLTAGLVTGGGVWATHFIAVLGYEPGFEVQQPLSTAVISLFMVVMLATAGFGVAILVGKRWSGVVGGTLLGLGISSMHFIAIASLQMHAGVIWLAGPASASVALCMLFAAAAVLVAQQSDSPLRTTWSAGLLTVATLAQHFIAMGAMIWSRYRTSRTRWTRLHP